MDPVATRNVAALLLAMVACSLGPVTAQPGEWRDIHYVESNLQGGIDCANPLTCGVTGWVGAVHAVVFSTTDGGSTWSTIEIDSAVWDARPLVLSYPSRKVMVVASDSSFIWVSKDSLRSFRRLPLPVQFGIEFVSMINDSVGLAGNERGVFVTTDQWATFRAIKRPDSLGRYLPGNGWMTLDGTVWLHLSDSLNKRGQLAVSSDTGRTWTIRAIPDQHYRVIVLPDGALVATGHRSVATPVGARSNQISRSDDTGQTWRLTLDTLFPSAVAGLTVAFGNEHNGVAAGTFGDVLWTNDGGRSWSFDTLTLAVSIRSFKGIHCFADGEAVAAMSLNSIAKRFVGSAGLPTAEPVAPLHRLSVRPLPADESVTVSITGPLAPSEELVLTDALGRRVNALIKRIDGAASTQWIILRRHLPPGLYIAHLLSQQLSSPVLFTNRD